MTIKEYKKNIRPKEESIQLRVCNYIKTMYPKVIFTCDLSSGMKLPIWMAIKAKKMRSGRGLPDIMILHPSGNFHALLIELKRDGVNLFKKNGEPADEHIKEQLEISKRLSELGYCSVIAVGFDDAIEKINNYFENGLKSNRKKILTIK